MGVTEQLLNAFEKTVLLSAKYKTYKDISHLNSTALESYSSEQMFFQWHSFQGRDSPKLIKLSRGTGLQQYNVLLGHGSNLFSCVTCPRNTTAGKIVPNFQLLNKFHQCTLHNLSDAKQHNVVIKVHKTTCTYFRTVWFHILRHKHTYTYKISSNSHP